MAPQKSIHYFGEFGGQFVAETLMPALQQLEQGFTQIALSSSFKKEFLTIAKDFIGRPTPLYFAEGLSKKYGLKIFLKREDLCHTGAHKVNNTLGQCLLAKRMKKSRIIAETGAGQHGVATATLCAKLGLSCEVYMGKEDTERQALNVQRMKMLGAKVIPVTSGTQTLKDALNEALRDWVTHVDNTFYCIGTVAGPAPYPHMVRHFQAIIGEETKKQLKAKGIPRPDVVMACIGGGSNAMGLFHTFVDDPKVKIIGVEAGGLGIPSGQHSASINGGKVGILHGNKTYLLQDAHGQIHPTHSISAGLDYPGVGPEHAQLHASGRGQYVSVTDAQALQAFHELCRTEGIIPALETSHALAYLPRLKKTLKPGSVVVINLSGRGDKDLPTVLQAQQNLKGRPS